VQYVLVTAPDGGIMNDPVLVRLGEQHFWLSLADSDVLLWALGVADGSGLEVTIREADSVTRSSPPRLPSRAALGGPSRGRERLPARAVGHVLGTPGEPRRGA
jgi:hypothetical protein